jgi:hypothetical protein
LTTSVFEFTFDGRNRRTSTRPFSHTALPSGNVLEDAPFGLVFEKNYRLQDIQLSKSREASTQRSAALAHVHRPATGAGLPAPPEARATRRLQ